MSLVWGIIFILLLPVQLVWASGLTGRISQLAETVHFELQGSESWVYNLKKTNIGSKPVVQLTIDPLDEALKNVLATFKSDLIEKVEVTNSTVDQKNLLTFYLKEQNIEVFDYLTDQPSRLAIDFYIQETEKKAAAFVPKKEASKLATAKKNDDIKRQIASDFIAIEKTNNNNEDLVKSGIFDGSDPNYERFNIKDYEIKEASILKSKNNYYIQFPRLETPVQDWEMLQNATTVYEVRPDDTDENKQARLLTTLFDKKRYAVFLKTLSWFQKKFPDSKYNEILDFMSADVHFSLWQDLKQESDYDQAQNLYQQAMQKYPNSALIERTSLKMGLTAFQRKDFMQAFRLFNTHIKKASSQSYSKDLAQLGRALAMYNLNRYDESMDDLRELENKSIYPKIKAEASFRQGDVLFKAKDYIKAISSYKNSVNKYSQESKNFPNAIFNTAEAQFRLKNFKESLNEHIQFIRKFPNQPEAAYSMTRLGEILEILGAPEEKVMGAFMETYFRFGESPEAVVARLRTISKKMKDMKPQEVEKATKDIMDLAKQTKLDNIQEFATILISDGFHSRKEYKKSIDLLSTYYKANPLTVNTEFVSRRIVQNITDLLQEKIDKKDFLGTLKTHMEYADNWLRGSNRKDVRYFVGLAYEIAGVPNRAEKYYREVLNEIYLVKGTSQGKELAVVEHLPTVETLNLRLAVLSEKDNKYKNAYEYLNQIKKPETLKQEEQIERVQLAVRLLKQRGEYKSATRYLTELLKTWTGQPSLLAQPYFQLAEIEIEQNQTEEAEKSLLKIDELKQSSALISEDLHLQSQLLLADIKMKKNPSSAIPILENILTLYEEKKPLARTRYKLGEIFFKNGDLQKAQEVWSAFKGEKTEFWQKMAQEQLKDNQWKETYKKYIQRIPAMAQPSASSANDINNNNPGGAQ